jgi:uncharacterized protein YbjT (DUF2867 family)
VLGATGDQGRPQVVHALELGHEVRAATRDPRRATSLPARAEPVAVDFDSPATLDAAMRDVEVVLANYASSSFNPGGPLIAAAEATAAAARAAGVRLIVFNTSLPVGDRKRGFAAQDVRFEMRAALATGGVPMISIQPVVYMDNLLRGWVYPRIVRDSTLAYPHRPDLDVSWLSLRDLARLMLAAAARPELAGQRFAVGGPQPIRGPEAAAWLSEAIGRRIEFLPLTVDEFCAALRIRMHAQEPAALERMLEELARIYRWYNESPERPFAVDMQPVLARLPVELEPFRDWARAQDWSAQRRSPV